MNKGDTRKKHIIKLYLVVLLIIILDQISKLIVMNNLILGKELEVIPNLFSLFYVTNTGAAFSSLKDQTTLLIIASVFCISLVATIIYKEKLENKWKLISLSLLMGGMIGNLIDRIIYKEVIDFLSITIFSYKFPVFNIADICITCGVFIYLFLSINEEIRAKEKKIVYNNEAKKGESINDSSKRRKCKN